MANIKILGPDRQPATRPLIKNKNLSEPVEDVVYHYVYAGTEYKLIAPKGFTFDGASIPRITWTSLGLTPHGPMDGPALPHDLVYHYKGRLPQGLFFVVFDGKDIPCGDRIPKAVVDKLLCELIVHFKVAGRFKANLVWAAVKLFGWYSWSRDDQARKDKLQA